jgi:signal transduction histidine kinase/DNA-binding response OmpR family regulator
MNQLLIVEDSPTQAELLRYTVEDAGFSVLVARDAETALELLDKHSIDLVISDIVMPGISGYDLCRRIKSSGEHAQIPVMLLSTLNEPMDIIRGLESGADNFLTKPYKPEQVVARTRMILQNRSLRTRSAVFGVEISFLGRTFTITSEKEQILDLLISTFEDTVQANRELQRHRAELAAAKIKLEEYARALEGRVILSEEKFRGFLTASPDAVIVVDESMKIVLASERIEPLFGYTPDELVDQPFAKLIGMAAAPIPGGPEICGTRKDGSTFPIETTQSAHKTPAGTVVITAVRDVTERLQMEEQLRHAHRIDAMGQLTGGLAHDFNNLLGVIIGNLDVIAARKVPGVQTFVENALEAADRGATLVKQLLAFARKQPLQPERISVQERSLKTVSLLESVLGGKIKIQHSVDTETKEIVADRSQLEAALLNLAVNARDAMPGGGTLTIECTNVTLDDDYATTRVDVEPGEYVMIAVSDTGVGMPPETQAKVFEPFFSTKGANGTGLGLSQVFGFAKQSGGHVSVYSEVGIGTTFRLYLPPAGADAAVTAEPHKSSPSNGDHGKETILVVDDNDAMREVAALQLHTLGYDVIVADTPNDALEVLRSPRNVDLLLTDIVMPGQLDGRELALRARELRPDLNVLFTSGFTESTLAASISADFAGHILSKPYRQIDLAKRLRDLLNPVEQH